jgi:hypothetical protein
MESNSLQIEAMQKRIFILGSIILMAAIGYIYTRTDVAEAVTDDVVVTLNVAAGISITSPSDTSMSATIGVTQNTAVATTTWNVKTNNAAGYTLTVQSSTDPAMQSGTDSVPNDQTGAPALWSTSAGTAEFGYSANGTDVSTGTWGTGSYCAGSGSNSIPTGLKYKGFTTSGVTVATRSSTTTTAGIDTNICYAVEQNGFYIPSGTYTATITGTATTL